jgi:acyl transferase domain-containing protein/acyl carrier protein
VQLSPAKAVGGGASVLAVDDQDRLVVSAETLVLREPPAGLGASGSLFQVGWERLTGPTAPAPPSGPWAVLGERGDGDLAGMLEAAGVTVHRHSDMRSLAEAMEDGAAVPDVVVRAVPKRVSTGVGWEAEGVVAEVEAALAEVLGWLQEWLADDRWSDSRLVLGTRHAVTVDDERGGLTGLVHAPVWGLVRSAETENPGRFTLVDLAEDVDGRAFVAAVTSGEAEVALRGEQQWCRRLVRASDPPVPAGSSRLRLATPRAVDEVGTIVPSSPGLDSTGTVLVTGGTGGLGRVVARHLVAEHGVGHVLLVSRRGVAASGAAETVVELESLGATVAVVACDVADRQALAEVLADVPAEAPLTAVLHAAGVLDDGVVQSLTAERLHRVLAAKVAGAWNLHMLTRQQDLAAFVLFSSVAGVFGAAGQGNYAAANTFLDALAQHRRSLDLPALSLAWGFWSETTGMTAHLGEADLARMRRRGFVALSADEGVRLLDAALQQQAATLVPAHLDLPVMRSAARAGTLPASWGRLVGVAAPSTAAEGGGTTTSTPTDLIERLRRLDETQARREVLGLVQADVAAVLGHTGAERVEPRRAFKELGFDSLTAVELRNRLQARIGLKLPPTLVFDHPSCIAVAGEVAARLRGVHPGLEPAPPRPAGLVDEPLAIVGVGCRFPGGVASPEGLWELVASGGDAISGFPTDRGWEGWLHQTEDGSFPRRGGFLDDVAWFDAGLFGISPREALAMDPQQRLLLEVSWEALERAGIDPSALRGSDTGVFVGGAAAGYDQLVRAAPGTSGAEGFALTGGLGSVVSGRVAYVLGLEAPAVSVDTACSSSLVALHLAGESLRRGECSLALAGGVTVLGTPQLFVDFAAQGGLAADGRCKAFAAGADGTGWSEGVGMVVVERLSDALAHGRRIWGVVRGSAVNQDGASNGLTAPNGLAQQRVVRQALANAGLGASDVDVVEAHGTGTRLGDPIEAEAILATYGQDRAEGRPLWLGSVKSNIGHTQAAAGVAGMIKLLMALRHGVLPKTLHIDEPTREVDWSQGQVELLRDFSEWRSGGRPRRAGVSSFGISGTNAHLILEEPPAEPGPETAAMTAISGAGSLVPVPLVVSGASPEALRAQAGRLAAHLRRHPELELADVGWSLATGRAALAHRAVVLVDDRDRAIAGLDALTVASALPDVVSGRVTDGAVGFVFPGQGSQRVGMGRELYESYTAFAESFDHVCRHFRGEMGANLRAVVFGEAGADVGLDETLWAQAGLFAVEVALVELLRSFGVVPDVVLGHSLGELAAAQVAGVLSLEDACRLVEARGGLMQRLPPGAMAALQASEAEVAELLADRDGQVSLAAVNSPSQAVISGDVAVVSDLAQRWAERGHQARRLDVNYGFHSSLVEPILEELEEVAASLDFEAPRLSLVSNVSGAVASDEIGSPRYWVEHTRQTVRFAQGVEAMLAQDVSTIIEVGPGAHLSALVDEVVDCDSEQEDVGTVPVLRHDGDEATSLARALAQGWVRGLNVDWSAAFEGTQAVDVPTYAFQRRHYWPRRRRRSVNLGLPAGLPPADDGLLADWRYRVSWRPMPRGEAAPLSGRWVLVSSEASADGLADWCAAALRSGGAEVMTVSLSSDELTSRQAVAARLGQACGAEAPSGVLSLVGMDEHELATGVSRGLAAAVALTQAVGDAEITGRLWCLTQGAVAIDSADERVSAIQAQVWGLGRVAALEAPQLWGGLVDLGEVLDDRMAGQLCAVLATAVTEDQIALRSSGAWVRRLVHAQLPGSTEGWTTSGTALVTGGTGALGRWVSAWLVGCGVEHVVLLGRRGADAPDIEASVAELERLGARVTVAACDVVDQESLGQALAPVLDEAMPVKVVVHAAGVMGVAEVDSLDVGGFHEVLSAKVAGARHLHELTQGVDLDAFVAFSSGAGVWGAGHQGLYAAANAYLDALIEWRRSQGLVGTSVAWGAWAGRGMADGEAGEQLRRRGVRLMRPEVAVAALGHALASDDGCLVVADIDWKRFAPSFTARRPSPLMGDLPEVVEALQDAGGGGSEQSAPQLTGRLAGLDDLERHRVLVAAVRAEAAAVLGYEGSEAVDPQRAFKDLGLDSVTAVELRDRLSVLVGRRLPVTLAFDHPNAATLAKELDLLISPAHSPSREALRHLSGLESVVASVPSADPTVGELKSGLRRVLASLIGRAGSGLDPADADVDSAGDDELLELIDREFGNTTSQG